MSPPGDPVELSAEECLALLGSGTFGRLALSVGALPTVVPVRYVVDGDALLLGVRPDQRLLVATDGAVLAFQADHHDPGADSWSVLVRGRGEVVPRTALDDAVAASLAPPGVGPGTFRYVRLPTDVVEGARWP